MPTPSTGAAGPSIRTAPVRTPGVDVWLTIPHDRPLPTPPGVAEQGEAARGEKKHGARFRSRDEAELIQGKVIRA